MNIKEDMTSKQRHIQVVIRVRPIAISEFRSPLCISIKNDAKTLYLKTYREKDSKQNNKVLIREESRKFKFDKCLNGSTTQEELYNCCGIRSLVSSAIKGYCGTVFAFGQTGSGKTYTVFGPKFGNLEILNNSSCTKEKYDDNSCNDGILPRAIHDIFEEIEYDKSVKVVVSCCEIYNEIVLDMLLAKNNKDRERHVSYDSSYDAFYVKELTQEKCVSAAQVSDVIGRAMCLRQCGSNAINNRSSRSHCIVTFCFYSEEEDYDVARKGKLCFVDLAGNERLKSSINVSSKGINEAKAINKSLFALGQVLSAIQGKQERAERQVPFRNSKLTQILWDGLRGNGHVLMLACCTPLVKHKDETLNTLKYANTAIRIKSHPVLLLNCHEKLVLSLKAKVAQLTAQNKKLVNDIKLLKNKQIEKEVAFTSIPKADSCHSQRLTQPGHIDTDKNNMPRQNNKEMIKTKENTPEPMALEWVQNNYWFGNDRSMTEYAYLVHDDLVRNKGNISEEQYYNEIEKRVSEKFPEKWKIFNNNSALQVSRIAIEDDICFYNEESWDNPRYCGKAKIKKSQSSNYGAESIGNKVVSPRPRSGNITARIMVDDLDAAKHAAESFKKRLMDDLMNTKIRIQKQRKEIVKGFEKILNKKTDF